MSRLRFVGVLLVGSGAVVGHDAAVDLAGEEPFEAADDVSLGEAFLGAAAGVVDGGLVEAHAHDDDAASSASVRPLMQRDRRSPLFTSIRQCP